MTDAQKQTIIAAVIAISAVLTGSFLTSESQVITDHATAIATLDTRVTVLEGGAPPPPPPEPDSPPPEPDSPPPNTLALFESGQPLGNAITVAGGPLFISTTNDAKPPVVFVMRGDENTTWTERIEPYTLMPSGGDWNPPAGEYTLTVMDATGLSAMVNITVTGSVTQTEPGIQNFDTVVLHFDGDTEDPDDIAALPIAAMLIDGSGNSGKTHIFFNNNLTSGDNAGQVDAMRSSAAFARKLGIETHDYVADSSGSTDALVALFNSGRRVLVLDGGPMEATYRALELTSANNRKNISQLSHHPWNEDFSRGGARTWADIANDFPAVMQHQVQDQNIGFNDSGWTWMDGATNSQVIVDARKEMENAGSKVNDPSDAGMAYYILTGDKEGTPEEAKVYFTANPPSYVGDLPPPDDSAAYETGVIASEFAHNNAPPPEVDKGWTIAASHIRTPVLPPQDAAGWSILTPSSDTRRIHVSNDGDDSRDGRTEATAVKTAERGFRLLREGYPDWLVFRCGDKWRFHIRVRGEMTGRNINERRVVTYYGDKSKGRPQIGTWKHDNPVGSTNHVAYIGLHFQDDARDPANGADAPFSHKAYGGDAHALQFLRGCENILVEDCKFRWWEQTLIFDGFQSSIFNIVLRRNIVIDAYHSGYRPQGIYAAQTGGLLIEQNVFDHNGWANSELFGRNLYNHNLYFGFTNGVSTIRDNFITRGSSYGLQLRSGGTVERNLMWGNAIGYLIGKEQYRRSFARSFRNIIAGGTHQLPHRTDSQSQPHGPNRGWGQQTYASADGIYDQNMIIDAGVSNPDDGLKLEEAAESPTNTLVRNHRLRNWFRSDPKLFVIYGGSLDLGWKLENNRIIEGGPSLDDALKAVYGKDNMEAYLDYVRNRPLGVWNSSYEAGHVCDWMWEALKDR